MKKIKEKQADNKSHICELAENLTIDNQNMNLIR